MKPSSGAIIATILGEYITRVLLHLFDDGASQDFRKFNVNELPRFAVKLIAALVVLSIFMVQAYSARLGIRLQNTVTAIKLLLLGVIPVVAIVFAAQGHMPATSRVAFGSMASLFRGSSILLSQYALALYSGLWAFDGWDQASFVAGEMKNPRRDVPRAIHASTLIVTAAFVSVVVSYFVVLPPMTVASTNSVALDFGTVALGPAGGLIFAVMVAFSCLGALNGHLYTYSRLTMAAGQDSFLPRSVGQISPRFGGPIHATVLSTALILVFVIFGSSFASLVNFCGVCAWFWYGTTVSSLLYLRIKEPKLDRPYKTWLITPVVFIAMALFLLAMPVVAAPWEALAAFMFIAAGIPLYYVSQKEVPLALRRYFPGASHDFAALPTEADEVELDARGTRNSS